jgi:hypothetical protein
VTIPPEVLIAAAEAVHAETCKCDGTFHEADAVAAIRAIEAAEPAICAAAAAAERERILAAAEEASFTLFRPGNGPAQGQSMQVVPLEALRKEAGS